MIVYVDKRIYSDSVISKAVYWLSSDYKIIRTACDEFTENIEVEPIAYEKVEDFEVKFFQLLNDFKLRQIVADETRDIKTILYARAFSDDDSLNESDIHD